MTALCHHIKVVLTQLPYPSWVVVQSKVAQRAHCYSDFWKAYAAVMLNEQHTAVSIRSGQTAHVERLNNTLRQRLGRLVRQTSSFSKSLVMHKACLHLFLHRYNLARAATFR